MTGRPRSWLAVALGLTCLGITTCRAKEDDFYKMTFPCNLAMDGNDCGQTREGRPMTCFEADQLGGTNFCAEACDPKVPDRDPKRFRCLESGARLQVCHPTASRQDASDPTQGCPAGLDCYRTSLIEDVGLCMLVPVCSADNPCTGNTRTLCAGTLAQTVSSLPLLTDNLQCLTTGCATAARVCQSGEVCLGSLYSVPSNANDICVPSCDADLHCPPNFACTRNLVSSPGAPAICVPGVPGTRCSADQDCIAGTCRDIGVEFRICALPVACSVNAQCAPLSTSDAFVCIPGNPGVCAALTVFDGANCTDVANSTDCPTGMRCFAYSPFVPTMPHGECRIPCAADGTCPRRGGLPHVCLGEDQQGGCYPGRIGMPCHGSSDCVEPLSCASVPPDPRSRVNYSPSICTSPCATDQDCNSPLTIGTFCSCDPSGANAADGSCPDGMGFCRVAGWVGAVCSRNEQCNTRNCSPTLGACVESIHP